MVKLEENSWSESNERVKMLGAKMSGLDLGGHNGAWVLHSIRMEQHVGREDEPFDGIGLIRRDTAQTARSERWRLCKDGNTVPEEEGDSKEGQEHELTEGG